jgi:hypothetical protein
MDWKLAVGNATAQGLGKFAIRTQGTIANTPRSLGYKTLKSEKHTEPLNGPYDLEL